MNILASAFLAGGVVDAPRAHAAARAAHARFLRTLRPQDLNRYLRLRKGLEKYC